MEDIFKRLLPHGKPDFTTHLQEKETIDDAINRLATSEESYKMYWILAEKSKSVNQGTYHARELAKDHAKILTSKARTAVNRALRLPALEGNLDEGLLEHTVANSHAKHRIRIEMSHEVLWEPTKVQTQGWESEDEEGMVKEGSETTGNLAGLLEMNRSTMGDGMPKLTKAGQLQIMQGKSNVIIKLQRELQKDIQDYKLADLQYLLAEPNQAIPKHNKGAKRQVKDVVLWERVPPGPGVPHTMVTKKSKHRHWCPHHHKWTQHTPKECKIQPVPDECHKVAPNGEEGKTF
jgi:hypothetical protein